MEWTDFLGGGCIEPEEWRFKGEEVGDAFGYAVAFVGNLEASNPLNQWKAPDDFVIGAPRSTFDAQASPPLWLEKGRAYVFLSSLFLGPPAEYSASAASLIIEGEAPMHRFGHSIAPAGDFNQDGWPDFVVGAPGTILDPTLVFPSSFGGKAYVISGKLVEEKALAHAANPPTGPQVVSVSSVAIHTWVGATAYDRLGFDVAFAPGMGSQADGIADGVIVSAPQMYFDPLFPSNDHWVNEGQGYVAVFRGAPANDAFMVTYSQLTGDQDSVDLLFGYSVSAVSDTDENGYSEILIAAPRSDALDPITGEVLTSESGSAYLVDPSVGAIMRTHEGVQEDEHFGWSVGPAGAYDSGTPSDYAIGSRKFGETGTCIPCGSATSQEAGGRIAGSLVVYNGPDGAELHRYIGEFTKDSLGWAFACVGDVDQSGTDDLIMAAMRWSDPLLPTTGKELGRIYYFPSPAASGE